MKKLMTILILACSLNAMAAKELCGITVQDNNIHYDTEKLGFGFYQYLVEHDGGSVRSCIPQGGTPVIVATFPNGEVRAIIF